MTAWLDTQNTKDVFGALSQLPSVPICAKNRAASPALGPRKGHSPGLLPWRARGGDQRDRAQLAACIFGPAQIQEAEQIELSGSPNKQASSRMPIPVAVTGQPIPQASLEILFLVLQSPVQHKQQPCFTATRASDKQRRSMAALAKQKQECKL